MKCAKCHKEREQGQNYHFYYGTKTETYRYGMGYKVKQTNYSFKGQGTEWICNACVRWRSLLSISVFIIFIAAIILIVYLSSTKAISNPAIFPVALIVFGISILVLPPGGQTEWGDRLAIRVQKKYLKKQGHNAFLTTRQYERMNRKMGLKS